MLTLTLTLTKGCAIPFSNYKNTFLWGKNQTGFFFPNSFCKVKITCWKSSDAPKIFESFRFYCSTFLFKILFK